MVREEGKVVCEIDVRLLSDRSRKCKDVRWEKEVVSMSWRLLLGRSRTVSSAGNLSSLVISVMWLPW